MNDYYNPNLKFTDVGTMTKSMMKMTSTSQDNGDTVRTNGGWQLMKKPDPKTESSI